MLTATEQVAYIQRPLATGQGNKPFVRKQAGLAFLVMYIGIKANIISI